MHAYLAKKFISTVSISLLLLLPPQYCLAAQTVIISANRAETLGGLTFSDGSLAEYDIASDIATLFFDEATFTGTNNENINAVHMMSDGTIIISTSGDAILGGVSFSRDDLVRYDPVTDSATLFFDGNNFSGNQDIDAVYVRANGNILLSTSGNATLAGLSFNDGDIVEYNPATNMASIFFAESLFAGNEDIDGFHLLDNGNLLISTTNSATLGGLSFDRGSIIEYNPTTNTATVFLDENLLAAGADINAVSLRMLNTSIHHIQLEHDGRALTCEAENIVVKICANADCSLLDNAATSISFTPTGWVGGDTQTVSGSATLALRNTSAQTITLGMSSSSPPATNPLVCLNTVTGLNDCTLTFNDSGFIYNIATQTSCVTSASITIRAVRQDNSTQACVPTLVNQTRNINFSLGYSNPGSGTFALTLNHNTTDYAVTPAGINVPINFDSNGESSFTVTYNDAGQLTLNSLYTGSVASGDAGLSMSGNASYVTKPARLLIFTDDANNACTPADIGCSLFKRAGEPFNLKIRGACNNPGNTVTPNFRLNGIRLTHDNIAPNINDGNLNITSVAISAVDNGEHIIANQSLDEVGVFTITAAAPVSGYFSEQIGDATLNTSANIGRFYPDHFCLQSASIDQRTDAATAKSCTDNFNYLDEQFTLNFALKAQAMGNVCASAEVTQNYDGIWSRFATPFLENTAVANEAGKWNFAAINDPNGMAQVLNSRISLNTASSSPSTGAFTNGQISVQAQLDINRIGSAPEFSAESPFNDVRLAMNPIDLDGVSLDSTTLTIAGNLYRELAGTGLFFGRLFAENAFGSNDASLGLRMFARSEYCNSVTGSACMQWLAKTNDSCTLYNILPPAGVSLGRDAANIGVPGYYFRAGGSMTSSSSFDFSDAGTAPGYALVHVPDTSGHSAGWQLFYTGSGTGGDFVIPFNFPFNSADSSVHPYLRHVNGVASFGHFRGDDRIIYWREIFE